jgi:hypothetical protein
MSNKLVQRLCIMFGAPEHSEDPQAYIRELARLTKSYPDAVLDRAADYLIQSHQPTAAKPWPTPADVCVACADAQDAINPVATIHDVKHLDWAAPALKRADALIQSPLGRKAADEGWILSLWDFCRKNMRLPAGSEITKCKTDTTDFWQSYAECERGGWAQAASLKRTGDLMNARRNQKSDLTQGIISDRKIDGKTMAAGERA